MRHQNSVLHGVLKYVPWSVFDDLVDEHGADVGVRTLTTKTQFVALLYAQLAGAVSLREIETAMQSHSSKLYHLGVGPVARATLSDANQIRSSAVFSGLFARMTRLLSRGFRRSTAEAVRLIDSTGVRLSGVATNWARYSKTVCGAKAHIIYDPDADRPVYLAITTAKTNDITAAKAMPIEAGATYVFDLGYYDFGWWAELDAKGCRIVTRLKTNTTLDIVEDRPLPQASTLLYDKVGHLPARMSYSRKNPFEDPVREIGVVLDTGKTIRILTNDLDASAQEIADLYKRRWAIELFFRWVKQNLRIKHFIGHSENAVRIQVAVALIAYLLIRLAKDAVQIVSSALAFARLLRVNLMHARPLDQLLKPPPRTQTDPRQLQLDWGAA